MASSYPVTVHPLLSLTAPTAYERGPSTSRNALIYIGGLTTGPHMTPQLSPLLSSLSVSNLSYSFWEFRMRSSYSGFGYSSIANDAEDLAVLVTYLRELGKEKIVILGSSSGCQAIMTYAAKKEYPRVDGYILQAPTSDRETARLLMSEESIEESLGFAKALIAADNPNAIMPQHLIPPIFNTPISAYRWSSLLSPGGDDDFFSSEIPHTTLKTTFGVLDVPTMILMSGNDEMVPSNVDKAGLLEKWRGAAGERIVNELSEVMKGWDHVLSKAEMQEQLARKMMDFLGAL